MLPTHAYPFLFIRKALENCSNIQDIEQLLKEIVRDGGRNLFVIDGKENYAALFECTCNGFRERPIQGDYIAATNHYCTTETDGTVYANIAEPSSGSIWFTHDAFPTASRGTWEKVEWT